MRWLLIVLTLAISAPATAAECRSRGLDILLTNDDGWQTPGIRALHAALEAGGHRVSRIAPADNASGSSASITTGPVQVAQKAEDVYAVAGTPATAVLLGVTTLLEQRPDLIVSGINAGPNVGPATPISGTVGAVIAGIRLLDPGVPGIAVSTRPVHPDAPGHADNAALNERIASFTARLAGSLAASACDGGKLLPSGVALNVNYPPVAAPRGVRLTRQGHALAAAASFERVGEGVYQAGLRRRKVELDGDTHDFAAGWITVVPIDGDYTASAAQRRAVEERLGGLTP